MGKIQKKLAAAEKEVLIDIVKNVQKRKMKGAQGDWNEFLAVYDKQLGDSLLDPKRRSAESLVAFLSTFTEKPDLKFFEKIMTYNSNRKAIEELNNCTGDESSPQKLATLTFQHPEYPKCYSFPTYNEDWVMTRIGKVSKAIKSTAMLSVDCEMVLCEDGEDALVQVCVVDQNLEVKLNELVKPDRPVRDYRTWIHGICAMDLERATCSLADIQKSMKKLLSPGVVLIGHSLDNDLKALKVDHARVIDTSLIYKYPEGHTHKRPSLNHLCKIVLGYELREAGASHNCLADAQAAMKLVLAKLERKFVGVIPLKRKEVVESELEHKSDNVIPLKSKEVFKNELEHKSDEVIPLKSKEVVESESVVLFFHAVPIRMTQKQLRGLFPKDSTVSLKPSFTGECKDVYDSSAVFKDSLEACNAFESFKGEEGKDSSGNPQKLISTQLLKGGIRAGSVSFYVRKVLKKESSDNNAADKRSIQVEETDKQIKKKESSDNSPAVKRSTQVDETGKQNKKQMKKEPSDKSPYVWKRSIQVEETEEQNKIQKESSDRSPADQSLGDSIQVEETKEQNKKPKKKGISDRSPAGKCPADKRSIEVEETKEQNKKQKKNSDQCDHVKDIQRLREEVAQRDSEVEETKEQNKKQKKNSDQCDHVKEIQRLREEVAQRDSELINAHNFLADLKKRRGLGV